MKKCTFQLLLSSIFLLSCKDNLALLEPGTYRTSTNSSDKSSDEPLGLPGYKLTCKKLNGDIEGNTTIGIGCLIAEKKSNFSQLFLNWEWNLNYDTTIAAVVQISEDSTDWDALFEVELENPSERELFIASINITLDYRELSGESSSIKTDTVVSTEQVESPVYNLELFNFDLEWCVASKQIPPGVTFTRFSDCAVNSVHQPTAEFPDSVVLIYWQEIWCRRGTALQAGSAFLEFPGCPSGIGL